MARDVIIRPKHAGSRSRDARSTRAGVSRMTQELSGPVAEAMDSGRIDAAYAAIQRQLALSGVDLSLFQRNAVLRRVARRMRLLQLSRVEDYAEQLNHDRVETRQLVRELQLPLGLLFRDPEVTDTLQRLLPSLLADSARPEIWVPGCGSGEEVWALAMLVAQAQAAQESPLAFTIFGTDSEPDLLEGARRGIFTLPDRVPQPLRSRYLRARDGVCVVSRMICDRAIFLLHDLTQPAPVFALDFICCRNLLAILEPAAQRRALQCLHAALKPGGSLLTGRLETLEGQDDLFVRDPRLSGLYRRNDRPARRQPQTVESNAGSSPVFSAIGRPALLLNDHYEIVDANPLAIELSPNFRLGPFPERIAAIDRPRLLDALRGLASVPSMQLDVALSGGGHCGLRLVRLQPPDGERRIFVELTAADAHEQLRALLASQAGRADALLRAMSNGVILLDAQGLVLEFNPVAERLTGWTRAEAIGQPYPRVFRLGLPANQEHPVECVLGDALPQPADRNDLYLQHRDGRRYAISLRTRPLPAATRQTGGAVVVFEDVSEMNLLTEELAYRATHDPLTGLLNRDEFEARARAALAEAKRSGVASVLCYIDVDQFKIINDTLGHVAGDELLHELAGELRSQLNETDVLARLGGDEFGVLLSGSDLKQARPVVEGLIDAARRFRFFWSGQTYAITISAGAAMIESTAENVTGAMSMADAACFVAKDAGRDRVRFAGEDDELSRRVVDMSLVGKIGKSLDENRFVLHYEDVVRIEQPDDIVYRELLVRMRDDDGKLLTPGAFIQAAERYFLMSALDRWVLHHALHGIAKLPADSVIYAVNISGQSLGDDKFLDFVLGEIDRSGVDPERLCFEITETSAVSRLTEAVRFMSRVADTGCRFALDDFGAGMASFSYLKNFRVDFLKIDGSFVRAMLGSRSDRGMVESINRIGHEMGLKTIAEHVESTALLEPLREMGVDWAQGRSIAWGRPFDELIR